MNSFTVAPIVLSFLLSACNGQYSRVPVGPHSHVSVGPHSHVPTRKAPAKKPESIQPERWVGTYEASETCGSTFGGTPIWADHVLRILFENDVLVAYLNADGYQTMTRLKGKVHLLPDRVVITKLEGFGDPNLKRGDVLIMLIDTGGELKVVWGAKYTATCWSPSEDDPNGLDSEKIEFLNLVKSSSTVLPMREFD